MERYHIFKLGLAILFYAAYCIRPMLVNGLKSVSKSDVRPEDYLVFYQVQDGTPGVDFPILSNIPRTAFSCQDIDSGYYADLDTDCQVFHICEEGRKISFLCPNGTIFDQSDLICEWWFKVNCTNSPNLYHESAELLRENLAKRKASRKVYLNGKEGNHGAVMRVEESSSITAKKGSKSFSPGTPNAISSNGNSRISHEGSSLSLQPSQRAINRNGERTDQKPKRYNDADTGNFVNKIDNRKNLKEYHVQFSQTSPGLDTASSEKHVWSTTPSSLNSVSSQNGQNIISNQANGNRGKIKFRPSFGTEEDKTTDEYDLEFPKHRSETIKENISSAKTDISLNGPGIQSALRGSPNLSTGGRRIADSEELQVPQETAAFAKNSYNSLRTSSRKQPAVNPYPNHRTTYSELRQPTLPTPRFIGSINSVTPQYITTQSINSGKPFVGSTVGLNIFGAKLQTSTLEPEISPFGRHISSTQDPLTSTTQAPVFGSSTSPSNDALFRYFITSTSTTAPEISSSTQSPTTTTTTEVSSVSSSTTPSTNASASRFYVSSSTVPPLERSTKRVVDHATVYGSFSKSATTPAPPSGVEVKFGKNRDKIGIQLSKSVGGEVAKYSSSVKPPLLKPNAVVHVGDLQGTVSSSTIRNSLPDSSLPVIEDIYRPSVPPTTEDISSITTTVKTNYPSSTANDIQENIKYKVTTSSPKISTTDKQDYKFQSTTSNSLSPQFGEGSTLKSRVPSRTRLDSTIINKSSIRPEIGSEGGSGVLLKPHTPDSVVKNVINSFSITTRKPIDTQINGGSTLRPQSGVNDGGTKLISKGDSSTKTIKAGISVGAPASTGGTSTLNRNIPESDRSTEPTQGEVFTERSEISTDLPTSTTVGPFNTVTLRGEPFKTNQQLDKDKPSTDRTQLVYRQSTTVKPSVYQVTLRGKPFKTSDSTAGEYTTERTGTTAQPVATITGRGRPFVSSQYPNETPTSTLGVTIYEVFTESTQYPTEQPITTTNQPISTVTRRGKPFSAKEALTETVSTEGGRIYEVFTESTTIKLPVNTVTRRGRPFGPTDSAVDSSEYETSTEHLQISNRQPDSTTTIPSRTTSGKLFRSNERPNKANPSVNVDISESSTLGESSTTSGPFGEEPTRIPSTSEYPKYGSAVNPPLLTSDAFVRISNVQSTVRPSESTTITQTESSNDEDSQRTTTASEKPEFFFSSTAAPLTGTVRTYSSTVVPPLLSKNAIIHVSDIQSTSRPLDENTSSFGQKIRPSIGTVRSTPLPNLKLPPQPVHRHTENVSKYGGFDTITNRPSESLSDDINISQNTVSSTLTPDVLSLSGSFRPKPVVVSPSPTIYSHGGKSQSNTGFYVTKNSVYDSSTPSPRGFSSTLEYEQSTPFVNVSPLSGQREIQPPQATLSAPKVESSFEKEVPLAKSESQWPRPFQRPNSLENKERATYLPTESTTSPYVTYKISSARPFMLPEGTPAPTVPSPFTATTPPHSSVYENVDNMINILKEIVNATDQDFSSETPRPGLIVPPSAGPQTLHTLAVYFANALDGIAAEREKLTGEQLDEQSKEKLTSLLTQMTMYRYKELFNGKEDVEDETTTVTPDSDDDSDNLIEAPGLRQLARNFSLALSSYLDNPETFRKDLESLRPTEPPQLTEDATETSVGDEELLNFSDADTKSSFPPAFPTLPSVTPTWGYIIAPKGSEDLDVKNSLNPDLHTSDTQSFVPGFNNLPAAQPSKFSKDNSGLPEDHWTDSPGATKLWRSAFSVNPAIVNDHFITEPTLLGAESTESYAAERSSLPVLDIPQSEVRYDLRALPKLSVNATEVRGLLIDFINTTKDDQSNRLQRLLKKLNTTENEFLSRMKEIDSNPLTKRLILLLISECGTNATKDIEEHVQHDLSDEALEASPSGSSVASYRESRPNSDIEALVDTNLREDTQDKRALQLLNSLYTIAAKFGK